METGESSSSIETSSADGLVMQEEVEEEEEETKTILPDELVERILALVSFPTVFKFRVLSKSWLARLSSISPQDDDQKKRLALSFRNLLIDQYNNWKAFCPFSLSETKEHLVAFDRTSKTSLRIPMPFFPLLKKARSYIFNLDGIEFQLPHEYFPRMEGTLLSLRGCPQHDLIVVNVLTRSWKQLPLCPIGLNCANERILLTLQSETHKVIVMPNGHEGHPHQDRRDPAHRYLLQIYDSTSAAWRTLKLGSPLIESRLLLPYSKSSNLEPVACIDGVLYLVTIFITIRRPFNRRRAHLKVVSIKIKDQLGDDVSAEDFKIVGTLPIRGEMLERVNPVMCKPNLLIIFLYLSCSARENSGIENIRAVHIDFGNRKVVASG